MSDEFTEAGRLVRSWMPNSTPQEVLAALDKLVRKARQAETNMTMWERADAECQRLRGATTRANLGAWLHMAAHEEKVLTEPYRFGPWGADALAGSLVARIDNFRKESA
jgi:hypothetical protein